MAKTRPHSEVCTHHASSLDPAGRDKLLGRLRRIEGQLRGIHKMIEEERYCADVLVQMSSVQESLRSAARMLLQSHLRRCVADAVESSDPARSEKMFEELTDLFNRYAR